MITIINIDGVLCPKEDTPVYSVEKLYEPGVMLLRSLALSGLSEIHLITTRSHAHKEDTEKWLHKAVFQYAKHLNVHTHYRLLYDESSDLEVMESMLRYIITHHGHPTLAIESSPEAKQLFQKYNIPTLIASE